MARSPAETPLMRQYLDLKEKHPDALLFFRCGDFYEMFFEDAVIAARALDLVLTSRDKGKEDSVPMCGVPYHAARGYLAKLTELGHKVAVCEQMEDPKLAKGLVKREIVRVITPGVVLDDDVLDPKLPRYLAAVVPSERARGAGASPAARTKPDELPVGLAYLDATTGELYATEVPASAVIDELIRVAPREVLADGALLGKEQGVIAQVKARYRAPWNAAPVPAADAARQEISALLQAGESFDDRPLALRAAATVVAYAKATQPIGTLPITKLVGYDPGDAVVLDETAIANLELVETIIGKRTQGSLLDVIDQTVTAPGGRRLRRWLLYPLVDVAHIRRRQDAVGWLVERPALTEQLRRALSRIADLERLAGKATLGVATPRDLGRLRDALLQLPELIELVRSGATKLDPLPELLDGPAQRPGVAARPGEAGPCGLRAAADPVLPALAARLAQALVDEPPYVLKDGGVIRAGYDATVDECRRLADGGKDEILAIEAREQKDSGIPNLKVRYNRVFGYYIEITKTHLAKVPAHYVRKQTIATGE
ncbi:MAG TPA: DNA mismatch repair protein MutS, partial [Kofleriaceae bacterium]|nr:DNA mismatch repair protein MutS [Kofleriaceae bacterium]